MSLKLLFGLEDTELTDDDILKRIKEALDRGLSEIEFTSKDGTKTKVKLPHADFGLYGDPWDGKQGKANYPGV